MRFSSFSASFSCAAENSDSDYEYIDDNLKVLVDDQEQVDHEQRGLKRSASSSPIPTRFPRPAAGLKTTGLDDDDEEEKLAPYAEKELGSLLLEASVCTRCQRERHTPVRDCRTIVPWLQQRHELLTISQEIMVECCHKYMRDVATRFGLDVATAGHLCRLFRWDVHRIGRHVNGLERQADRDHLHGDGAQPPDDDSDDEEEGKPTEDESKLIPSCPICYDDDKSPEDMVSMECGHAFCRDCWCGFIAAMLSEGHATALQTTCPTPGCQQIVSEVQIKVVAPDLLPKYEKHQLQSFLQESPNSVRWCPGPDCDRIAVKPRDELFEDNATDFLCGACRTNFCFTCGKSPHNGDCQPGVFPELGENDQAAHLVFDEDTRQLDDERDDEFTKKCPKCTFTIEKIGGCNRMQCKCGHYFCWLCLGDYSSYGSHFCQSAGPPLTNVLGIVRVDLGFVNETLKADGINLQAKSQDVLQQLKYLERYAHHYNRYAAHDQGQHFAERQCPCLENCVNNYTKMAGISSGTDIDFIRSANEMLVSSRCLLKYTYCSAFFSRRADEEDDAKSHLGFHQLERLERFTEELSEVSENAVSRQDRQRVLDLISAVEKYMSGVADFEFHE